MATNVNRLLKSCSLTVLAVGLWASSNAATAACLLKPQQVDPVGTVHTLMLVPEHEVAEYLSLGFSRVACPTDLSITREYVERLCDGAARGALPGLNADAIIGQPRERVCESARAGLAEAGG
jgi:hypothetical protein